MYQRSVYTEFESIQRALSLTRKKRGWAGEVLPKIRTGMIATQPDEEIINVQAQKSFARVQG